MEGKAKVKSNKKKRIYKSPKNMRKSKSKNRLTNLKTKSTLAQTKLKKSLSSSGFSGVSNNLSRNKNLRSFSIEPFVIEKVTNENGKNKIKKLKLVDINENIKNK